MPRLREIFPLIAIVSVVLVRGEIYFAIWLREEGLDVAHASQSIRGVLLFAVTFIVCNRAGSGSSMMPRGSECFLLKQPITITARRGDMPHPRGSSMNRRIEMIQSLFRASHSRNRHQREFVGLFLTLLLAIVMLSAGELNAQFVDFEINPITGNPWVEGDIVTDQYEASHGLIFSYSINGVPSGPGEGPMIVEVGGTDASGFCAFQNGSFYPDECLGVGTANRDNINYSVYPPTDPLDDIKCFFITDNVCGQGMITDFVLRITYTDAIECFQLSGRLLDTDTHSQGGGTNPWSEGWTVDAYGTVNGNPDTFLDTTGNIGVPTGSAGGDGSVQPFSIDVTGDGTPIDYIEISFTGGPAQNVNWGQIGLGFDNFNPCSIGASCSTENPIIECGSATTSDEFTLTFDVVNNSGFDVTKLVIPGLVGGVTVSPNIIDVFIPDDETLFGVQLFLNGGNAGDIVCIPVGLLAKDATGELFECCGTEVCVELPACCMDISGELFSLDLEGNLIYDFSVTNFSGDAPILAEHLFMSVISPPGAFFAEEWHALNGLLDGAPAQPLSTVIYGAVPGDTICFQVTIHDATLSECCGIVHCVDTLPFTSPPPEFLRGDANSDGAFDISDVVGSLDYLFQGQSVPCLVALDSNDDETVDIGDTIFSLEALFGGGPSPWPPYQQCGVDETSGNLGCEYFPACEGNDSGPQGG